MNKFMNFLSNLRSHNVSQWYSVRKPACLYDVSNRVIRIFNPLLLSYQVTISHTLLFVMKIKNGKFKNYDFLRPSHLSIYVRGTPLFYIFTKRLIGYFNNTIIIHNL